MKYRLPRMKLGTTSFLVQDYYIPAIRYVSAICDDIALLVAEPGEKGENLITEKEVREAARIANGEGVSFNIHLPTESHFETEKSIRHLTRQMEVVIDRVRMLEPHSWVLHVEYPSLTNQNEYPDKESRERTADALARIASFLPSPEHLCLENLETFPIDFWDEWLAGTSYSRCLDIGHIWKEGLLPEDYWERWKPRIRMCHLHGLGTRDHQSVANMPEERIDGIMHPLWKDGFNGAITLEVFKVGEFKTSYEALMASYQRYIRKNPARQ